VVTAGEPPEFEPPPRPDLPESGPEPPRTNIAMVALIAFAFGVFLHGCVALSILDDGSSSANTTDGPSVEPVSTAAVSATATRLPDRTSCSEIQGTDYRSTTERDFYRANCLATATPVPSATPTGSPAATATQRP
jgi:hypothetical protein